MAKTQPGGYYLSPNGTPHDAWNRPVEEGVSVLNPPVDPASALRVGLPIDAGLQPIGGMIDSPAPGSDQYRAQEQRIREQSEALQKEADRLSKEAEKMRAKLNLPVDLHNLNQILAALRIAGYAPPSAMGESVGPTREEHKEAGERWVEQQEARNEKLAEHSLAVDTNQGEEKKLDKSGQTEGEADMKDASKKGKSKKEE